MALTRIEREEFLSEPHIAALSVESGTDRAPLTVPIWYQYEPGGQPLILTGKTSKKAELIRAAGRFTLMVERLEPSIRYVTVSGTVDRIDDATHEQLRQMTHAIFRRRRWTPTSSSRRTTSKTKLRPQHWLSADLGQV